VLKVILTTTLAAAALTGPALAAQPSQAQMVQELYDRQQILELMAGYGQAMDSANGDAFAKLFTPDARLIAGGGEEFKGTEALRRIGASSGQREVISGPVPPRGYPVHHQYSNVSMNIRGDTASVRANWVVINGRTNVPAMQSMGHYEDKLVKRGGRWIYTERRIVNETLNRPAPGPN